MSDSESDIEEIKLSDIKEKYEKEQEKANLKKKKAEIFDKYKDEIEKDLNIDNKPSFNLLKEKKVQNKDKALENGKNSKHTKLYEKDDFLLGLSDDINKPIFKPVSKDLMDFKTNHFFGNRIKRVPLSKVLSKK